jgi:hypothetical protein
MRTGAVTMLGFHDHYVVDGGKGRIILAALVNPADVMENVPLRDLPWRVCFRHQLRPRQVTSDTTYGTVENIVAVEDARIQAFFPLPDFNRARRFSARLRSPMTPCGMPTAVPRGSCWRVARPSTPSKRCSTGLTPRSATRASSKPSVPPASRGASFAALSTRSISTKCADTTPRSPTRRPCGNGRSGSSRGCARCRVRYT